MRVLLGWTSLPPLVCRRETLQTKQRKGTELVRARQTSTERVFDFRVEGRRDRFFRAAMVSGDKVAGVEAFWQHGSVRYVALEAKAELRKGFPISCSFAG